jgi:hypothetical protein
VQSLHLKTGESVALPLWTCGLGEEGRWDGLVKDDETLGEDGLASDDEMDVDEVLVEEEETPKKEKTGKKNKGTKGSSEVEALEEDMPKKKAKGTKRPSEEEVQEEEKPKKKAKATKRPSEEEAQDEDKPKKKVKKGVDSAPEVTLDSPVPVKKKRKVSLVPEPIVFPEEPETSTSAAVHEADNEASKKKKKRKSIVEIADAPKAIDPLPMVIDAAAEADIDTEPSEPISNPKEAKRKSKSRASLDLAADDISAAPAHRVFVPVSVPEPEAAEQTNPKKQKKARASVVEADVLMVAEPTEIIPAQPPTEAEVSIIELPSKKPKLNKKAKARLAAADDNIDAAPLDPVSAPATSDTPVDSEKKKKTKKIKALAGDNASNDVQLSSAILVDDTTVLALPDASKEGGKKGKKKKAKVAGSDQVTDATPLSLPEIPAVPASADSLKEGKKKSKNAKPAGSEPVTDATPLPLLGEPTVSADAPEDGQTKKKKKKAKAAANVEPAADIANTPITSTENISTDGMEKKRKKVKGAAGAESANDTAPEDGAKKTKKKNVTPAADVKPVHDYTTAASDSATIAEDSSTKKSRKQKKEASPTDVDMPVSNALSKDELKQKRLADGGERKKDKVVKKKGKSAKDAILGRKAGQA